MLPKPNDPSGPSVALPIQDWRSQLEERIAMMLHDHPFHAWLLIGMAREFQMLTAQDGENGLGWAAKVSFRDRRIVLTVSDLFYSLSPSEQVAVLMHEIEHIVRQHPQRGLGKVLKVWLIAIDLVVNQYIQGLPKGSVTLEWANGFFPLPQPLEYRQAAEYYYQNLLPYASMMPSMPDLEEQHDWGDEALSPMDLQDVIQKAVRKAYERAAGHVPAHLTEAVAQWLVPTNPWPAILKRFVASHVSENRRATWRRLNRRMPDVYRGTRERTQSAFLVVVDTSGSMASADLELIWGHLRHIADSGVELWVMQADMQVQEVRRWTRQIPEFQWKGRGGTDFRPAFKWALDPRQEPRVHRRPSHWDGLIYMTDGDGPAPDTKPPIPTLWAVLPGHTAPVTWGWHMTLPTKH